MSFLFNNNDDSLFNVVVRFDVDSSDEVNMCGYYYNKFRAKCDFACVMELPTGVLQFKMMSRLYSNLEQ